MKYEITLPEGVPLDGRATVGHWLKEIGDNISKGEVVLTIDTKNVVLEIESEFEGMLGEIYHDVGEEIGPGDVLGIIENDQPDEEATGGADTDALEETEDAEAGYSEDAEGEPQEQEEESPTAPLISARARWLAAASGVAVGSEDKEQEETGTEGTSAAEPARNEMPLSLDSEHGATGIGSLKQVTLTAGEQVQAQRMTQAHRDIPQYDITIVADVTALVGWRNSHTNAPSITATITKLCAQALVEHPRMFGTFLGRSWRQNSEVNAAVAVDSPHGLIWPVVHDVQGKSIEEVNDQLAALAEKARNGELSHQEIAEANFMITNLGMFGIECCYGLLMPGIAAVLGVGVIDKQPRLHNGTMKTRDIVRFTLGCDRRMIDGATAARFLARLKELTEHLKL